MGSLFSGGAALIAVLVAGFGGVDVASPPNTNWLSYNYNIKNLSELFHRIIVFNLGNALVVVLYSFRSACSNPPAKDVYTVYLFNPKGILVSFLGSI